MIQISSDTLRNIARDSAGRQQKAIIESLAPELNRILPKYGLTTTARVAHFLTQAAAMTGGFNFVEESDQFAQRYEGRRDLGNTQSGDGVRFKGRGLFPIVGRENYRM